MIEKKHIVLWIVGGIAVAVLLIFFAMSNGVVAPFSPYSPFSKGGAGDLAKGSTAQPGGISNAPAGVSYNQADLNAAATSGKPVVVTGAPEQPGQSLPIPAAQIPTSAIKLSVQGNAFTPSTFTVRAGETVVLSITAEDGRGHSFNFNDSSLSSVSVGVGPHETRVITFTAPAKPGTYTFRGTIAPDSAGTMIVK